MIEFILIPFVSYAISLILVEYFNIGFRLKLLFKIPTHEIKKPYDCRFCLYFWISNIITLSLSFLTIPQLTIILVCFNTFIAHLIDQYYGNKEI